VTTAVNPRAAPAPWTEAPLTGRLVLADGTVIAGHGLGAVGSAVGEVCFNTAITGYQEILTDPSYAGQIITFTFPHIGNVGTNSEDTETSNLAMRSGVRGCVLRANLTEPSNYRAADHLDRWLKVRGIIALAGVDTRALTARIRERGMPNGVIAHELAGRFDLDKLKAEARAWPGLLGLDLVPEVTAGQSYTWDEMRWVWGKGYQPQAHPEFHVVAVDYGLKRNILRCLASAGCRVTVVPATASAQDIVDRRPDGVFLSNGPGDPAAVSYAPPIIRTIAGRNVPIFGICLGHQLLGLTFGGRTVKMPYGHRGGNHPVRELDTGHVLITSQNHGFAVEGNEAGVPGAPALEVTHINLNDQTIEGMRHRELPIFAVQYHPEAAPGPHDARPLFGEFIEAVRGKGRSEPTG
jgi:carbamoyl-phosphate synthase small subunit